MRNFGQKVERFLPFRGNAQRHVCLLGDDDDANGGQHAVDHGGGHEIADRSGFHEREHDLDDTSDQAHGECPFITQDIVAGAQFRDSAKGDHDQARGRTFDGQPGAAHEGNE